ncbi:MAG: AAC(3) family N-acetyltransferase [Lactobacillus mulieris]|jgi:aminoglycoside N(3')-acetyltransferase|uniref:Aminoglycoside N(3)-acetyltransferase n=1 Tax=Lactobacillus mulieris TaxID=2508708 RepID=A0AAP3M3T9_9LACO|nr:MULTISPECIES: AAC(3) family N-acetyltransferase [Lactobacillus]EFH29289.1 aminoglycoside 3-N-acetyltransferase [Lactobacillus jensenii JV-V16]KAA9245327.1 AAC(3) family N-acetyltransferase [Lactobacillus jensenii]MCF1797434.1 AAC(3) family N-acetyltransferase [Lactobacillus mulieris]MCT7674520.1 AAC(3) family N-acetyltransferase [Lactobacillus mulieris]MCT7772467.1 AAC(3) family N-acetyltransferase [Lactobacillus mulieris]
MEEDRELIYSDTDLAQSLREMGISSTDTLLVNLRMSALGIFPGKQQSLFSALKLLVKDGNIILPSFSLHLKEPQVRAELKEKIMKKMPAFDSEATPVTGLDSFMEYFRMQKEVLRDNHPIYSFSAWGKDKETIVKAHTFDLPFGKQGVLGRLLRLNAKVVCLGTNFETCLAPYLAESEISRPLIQEKAPVLIAGEKVWVSFNNVELNKYHDYEDLGTHFLQKYPVKIANLPAGQILIFNLQDFVNFACDWYQKKDRVHLLNAGWKGPEI